MRNAMDMFYAVFFVVLNCGHVYFQRIDICGKRTTTPQIIPAMARPIATPMPIKLKMVPVNMSLLKYIRPL